jgi:oxaloacetate decarboxylase gamma subunit
MTPNDLLMEGVELMLIGMACVLAFLILLIGAIRCMSALIVRFVPESITAETNAPSPHSRPAVAPAQDVSSDVLAAIQAAIHQHRGKRG